MFCTKPGTKTQLVYITSPCMKQQISTPPPRGTQWGGTFGDALALLTHCLSLQRRGTKRSLLSIPLSTCTQKPSSPGRGSSLLPEPCTAFTHALPPQPPWRVPPRLEGRDRAAGLPTEHELSRNSRRQKGESCGLHPGIHTAQLRTWIKQHTLLQVHPYCSLFSTKKRGTGRQTWYLVKPKLQVLHPPYRDLQLQSYLPRKANHQGVRNTVRPPPQLKCFVLATVCP